MITSERGRPLFDRVKNMNDLLNPVLIYSVLVSLSISTLLGPIIIPLLHRLKFGQT